MKPDPTIDDIRQVRHQISASVNHDAKKLVEHYRELQKKYRNYLPHPQPLPMTGEGRKPPSCQGGNEGG